MQWLLDLFTGNGVPHTILMYSIIIASGILLGKMRIAGISLGVTFVLFVGILMGHLGVEVPVAVLDFIKDFGLILFIFSIGMQVGPGFFSSFKKGGVMLNAIACVHVLLGVLTAVLLYYLFFSEDEFPMIIGVLSGAVTNTPGLGAAEEALRQAGYQGAPIGLGYAVAYPMGVLGIILTMVGLRYVGRIRLDAEESQLTKVSETDEKPDKISVRMTNHSLDGKSIAQCKSLMRRDFVVSRMQAGGDLLVPAGETIVHVGDILLVIAAHGDTQAVLAFLGEQTDIEWKDDDSTMVSRRIVITRDRVNGKTIGALRLRSVYGVNITRVNRSGIDLLATPDLVLQVGDRVMVVGPVDAIRKAEKMLGNTLKRLNEPHLITIFVGILIGILVGSIPIYFPGMPTPAKLGLAGGPLIVSILLGRFGYKIKLITYTTQSANLLLRELGISLFLASVGLSSGASFIETVLSANGLKLICCGAIITLVPAIITSVVGRLLKLNYFTIIGLIAGSSTNPPALAYTTTVGQTDAPAVAYSTVYPLVMFLRILLGQILVLAFLV